MKTIVLITTASALGFTAFAQGHAGFSNDTTRLVYYHNVPGHPDGDPVWAGNSTIAGQTYNFMADLYMGTSSDALSLISSVTFSTLSPGKWSGLNVITPFAFGATLFTVVQVRDANQTPPNIWTPLTVLSGPMAGRTNSTSPSTLHQFSMCQYTLSKAQMEVGATERPEHSIWTARSQVTGGQSPSLFLSHRALR